MTLSYPIIFERASESELPPDFYYAHVPALGLTTHGAGVDGARAAVIDLLTLWLAEKRASGEIVPRPGEFLFSTVELNDDALQSA